MQDLNLTGKQTAVYVTYNYVRLFWIELCPLRQWDQRCHQQNICWPLRWPTLYTVNSHSSTSGLSACSRSICSASVKHKIHNTAINREHWPWSFHINRLSYFWQDSFLIAYCCRCFCLWLHTYIYLVTSGKIIIVLNSKGSANS